ncbi:flavin reductase family protein [Comamonas faecalis]|uniref:Flavin reductase family protein n=1 Tax=Comamonas faecalis TaxID=1387849 RepID=A0ABP7QN01_9BURK
MTSSLIDAPSHSSTFTTRALRDALGMFATGVTIVTTLTPQGQPIGMTASSFNSVALNPPLVLWSLSQLTASMPVFAQAGHYAIHVLAVEQRALAERFATRGIDRFAGTAWHEGMHGLPIIDDTAAVFVCANRSQYPEGDHTIFVGQVEHCSHRAGAAPLLYHGGMFYTEHPLGSLSPRASRPMNK